jgi:hypothetical protein
MLRPEGSEVEEPNRTRPPWKAAICSEPVELHVAALQKSEYLYLEEVIISTSVCTFAQHYYGLSGSMV